MTTQRKEERWGGRKERKGGRGEGKRDGGKKPGTEKTSRGQRRNKVICVRQSSHHGSKVLCNPPFICLNPNPVSQNVSIFGDRNLKKRLR